MIRMGSCINCGEPVRIDSNSDNDFDKLCGACQKEILE